MLKKYFINFNFFYKYLGSKIIIALVLSILVGVLDGFGLAMFLPLLEVVGNPESSGSEALGYLSFLITFLNRIGLDVTLLSVLSVMIFFFVLKGFAVFFQGYYSVTVQQFFLRKLRVTVIDLINSLKFKAFISTDVGRIQNSLTGEIERLSNAYKGYFEAMKAAMMILVYMTFAFLLNPQFALLVVVGGGLTNFLYRSIYLKTKQASRKLTTDTNFFQGQVIQYILNFKYLKATSLLGIYSEKLKTYVNQIEKNNKKIGILTSILTAAREPMMIIVVCVVIYIQIKYVGGDMTSLLVSLLFFYRALAAMMQMQGQYNFFIAVSGSMENVTSLIEELDDQKEVNIDTKFEGIQSDITLTDASFGYNANELQIKNINLRIKKNDTVAFVGESGSGKTTLVNVIAGLLPLSMGSMKVDGNNIGELNKLAYQRKIGYITQEPVIFNDTIYNNITFWADKTQDNLKRFKTILEKASLESYIENLSEKEDTLLGNNGINISGGQKQRISIARELFKDIDILIMDEATSALDSETEKMK